MNAANFFVPSFLKAINENEKESFRSIMTEPSPGVYTFEMLQPHFCELLVSEVSSLFLLRWKILKDGSMRQNSESCDLTQ